MSRAAGPAELVVAARAAGISDELVLAAMTGTPRAGFVPARYVTAAYRDEPIPIGHGQVTTQPSLSARMIEGLRLAGGDHVLEIGTGLGYQTALLARLAASVVSIERWPGLAGQARRNLARQGIGNVQVLAGDGSCGLPDRAPTTPSWSRPHSRRSPRRWQPSSGSAAAWCSRSDQAGKSRSCCSSVPRPGWSGGRCSPWPDSSGCTGVTDSGPGPDQVPASALNPAAGPPRRPGARPSVWPTRPSPSYRRSPKSRARRQAPCLRASLPCPGPYVPSCRRPGAGVSCRPSAS